jgi:4-amino-4-deoxychorismate lyase
MPAESPVPVALGLIETFLWTRAQGYWLAEGHLDRMRSSARELGFVFFPEVYERALAQACENPQADCLRVRLELSRDGAFSIAAAPFTPEPAKVFRAAVAQTRLDSRDPLLRHKTTRRAIYEDALSAAQAADPRIDEVIFLNERGEVCEGARTNVFLPSGRILLTPPLACGLLAGVLRADLLSRGQACEHSLHLDDLSDGFMLGNALRGQFRASFQF